jgi:FixJ family two-component response regulator
LHIAEGLRDSGYQGPIVVISAFGDDVLRGRLRKLDDVRFLAKPFSPVTLANLLAEVTARKPGDWPARTCN